MRQRRLGLSAVVVIVAFTATACEGIVAPWRIDALKKDLDTVATQIKAAETEDSQYAGGLIKAVIGARLATLRHTHAMLDQRLKSWTFGIGLRYTVDGKRFVPDSAGNEQATAIEKELPPYGRTLPLRRSRRVVTLVD